jgi:hypothetical protein
MPNLVQKDYTFETTFDATIFNYRNIIKVLENGEYNIVGVEKKWSLRRPFRVILIAIIKVVNEIDVEEIRNNRMKTFMEERFNQTNKGDLC